MAWWEIRLCGRVAVSNSDGLTAPALPGRQGQLLLAYLVHHRTRACPRYELEDVLWPKDVPASSDSALSSLLSKLRRALGPDARLTLAAHDRKLAYATAIPMESAFLSDLGGLKVTAMTERERA